MRHPRAASARVGAVGAAAAILAACTSGSGAPPSSSSQSTTVGTTSATSTTTPASSTQRTSATTTKPSSPPSQSPQVKAAELAYARFNAAYIVSEMKPRKLGQPWPPGGDFTKYSFVPFSTASTSDIIFLSHNGLDVPRNATRVSRQWSLKASLDCQAPQVVLSDCPTAPASWNTYNVSSGKIAPNRETQGPAALRESAWSWSYKQSHWGVLSAKADTTKTCHR